MANTLEGLPTLDASLFKGFNNLYAQQQNQAAMGQTPTQAQQQGWFAGAPRPNPSVPWTSGSRDTAGPLTPRLPQASAQGQPQQLPAPPRFQRAEPPLTALPATFDMERWKQQQKAYEDWKKAHPYDKNSDIRQPSYPYIQDYLNASPWYGHAIQNIVNGLSFPKDLFKDQASKDRFYASTEWKAVPEYAATLTGWHKQIWDKMSDTYKAMLANMYHGADVGEKFRDAWLNAMQFGQYGEAQNIRDQATKYAEAKKNAGMGYNPTAKTYYVTPAINAQVAGG